MKTSFDDMARGLNLNASVSLMLELLLGVYDDESFLANYWKGSDRQVIAVMDYREHVMSKTNSMSYETFLSAYHTNKKDAIELLFLFPCTNGQVAFVEEMIESGHSSLYDIYQRHMEEPNVNVLKLLA